MWTSIHHAIIGRGLLALSLTGGALFAQEELRIPFSDPSATGRVEVSIATGRVEIEGYEGSEVIVSTTGPAASQRGKRNRQERDGLPRIGGGMGGYSLEEQQNVVRLNASPVGGSLGVTMRVPQGAAVKVRCLSCEVLRVQKLHGGIDIENMSGLTEATNVSGAINIHSLSGEVKVSLDRVEEGKAIAISAMTGDIDLTVPGSAQADFSISTMRGDVFSNLNLNLQGRNAEAELPAKGAGGGYQAVIQQNLRGKLNGGGAPIRLRNFSGDILIRQNP